MSDEGGNPNASLLQPGILQLQIFSLRLASWITALSAPHPPDPDDVFFRESILRVCLHVNWHEDSHRQMVT